MSRFAENIGAPDFWLRLLYTLLFALAWQVSEVLIVLVAVLQLGYRLFTGAGEPRLTGFGASLSDYTAQIGRYVTQASEQKPWPFIEWPAARAASEQRSNHNASATLPSGPEAPTQP